jgi:uncharacterized protein (DUF1778 family)
MPEVKDVTLSIRTTATVKELLRLAAKREHRSAASMVERLILDHAEKYALGEEVTISPGDKGSKK